MPANEGETAADDDLAVLSAAVAAAAAVALEHWRGAVSSWRKDDGTPVSQADIAVDDALRSALRSARPGYGWLSEESGGEADRLGFRRVWVVDPIDGTRAFIDGGQDWCISAALVEDGRPLAGIIHAPALGIVYAATVGGGAFANGQRLATSPSEDLAGARIMVAKNLLRSERWRTPWPAIEQVTSPSLALRLARLAQAECDGVFAIGAKSDWDLAAGDLIVQEAGGRVGDLSGKAMVYNRRDTRQHGLIAAGAGLFAKLVEKAGEMKTS